MKKSKENRKDTYGGRGGDSLNRVVTVQKHHEKRAGNGRTGSDAGDLKEVNSPSYDK